MSNMLTKIGYDVPFTQIPNEVIQDMDLSTDAFAIWTYLASKPDGWLIRPDEVMKRWGMTQHRWRKASAELKELGLFEYEYKREGGKILGKFIRLGIGSERTKPAEEDRTVVSQHYGDTAVRSDNTYINKEKDRNKERDTNNYRDSGESRDISVKKRFVPPTEAEIAAHMVSKGYEQRLADDWAEDMHNFYASKGWLVGKTKMKCWKSAASNWAKRSLKRVDDEKCNRFGKDSRTRAEVHADTSGNWLTEDSVADNGGNGLFLR